MKRPLGVWIIGILVLIGAIFRILGGITALGVSGLAMTGSLGEETVGIGGEALGIGIVYSDLRGSALDIRLLFHRAPALGLDGSYDL